MASPSPPPTDSGIRRGRERQRPSHARDLRSTLRDAIKAKGVAMKRFAPLVTLCVCLLLCLPAPAPAGLRPARPPASSARTPTSTSTPTRRRRPAAWEITIGWTYPDGNPTQASRGRGRRLRAGVRRPRALRGHGRRRTVLRLEPVVRGSRTAYKVGRPFFFSVSPSIADVRYHLTVDFTNTHQFLHQRRRRDRRRPPHPRRHACPRRRRRGTACSTTGRGAPATCTPTGTTTSSCASQGALVNK